MGSCNLHKKHDRTLVKMTIETWSHVCYNIYRKQNNGSAGERQLPCTCAGDCATYTTGYPAPSESLYPFCVHFSRGYNS